MTTWDASDGSPSPNRVDWLVHGVTALGLVRPAADWTGAAATGTRF